MHQGVAMQKRAIRFNPRSPAGIADPPSSLKARRERGGLAPMPRPGDLNRSLGFIAGAAIRRLG